MSAMIVDPKVAERLVQSLRDRTCPTAQPWEPARKAMSRYAYLTRRHHFIPAVNIVRWRRYARLYLVPHQRRQKGRVG